MIFNKTKKKVIVKEKKTLKSNLSKSIGLMFSKKIKDKGLVFAFNREKRHLIHMFFVFFPIDVLFLDKDKKVVEIKERLMPFSFYSCKKKSKYFIELPIKTIKRTKTKINHKIEFST